LTKYFIYQEITMLKSKYQLIIVVAAITAIMLVIGGLAMSLAATSLPAAEARANPAAQAETGARTITVVGEGKVKVKPDVAQASIGVEVVGPDVKQASSDATATMEKLLEALKAQGVAENDIQTAYFNVWVERPYTPEGGPSTEAIYHVSNTVNVTIRDLSQVATTLGAAIEAGANSINSVNFNVADASELKVQARQAAVAEAKAKAQELAGLNGVTLGEVVNVSEVVQGAVPLFDNVGYAAQGVGGGVGPISPGEIEVTVQLQVSYAIQ
jgi:hypothetical protein